MQKEQNYISIFITVTAQTHILEEYAAQQQ